MRACYAADRTGHMILQTLYQQCVKRDVRFFNEFYCLDLLCDDGGVTRGSWRTSWPPASSTCSGPSPCCSRPAATGGCSGSRRTRTRSPATAWRWRTGAASRSRTWSSSSSIRPASTRWASCCARPPAARAASCCNKDGERFMERYAPTIKDLAPRDMVEPGDLPGDQGGPRRRANGRHGLPGRAPPRPEGDRGEAPRHHGVRARLPARRADDGARPDPAHRALRDGRHPDRHRRAGRDRRRRDAGARPVRGRRVRVRERPRREPPGDELAARHRRVRPARRRAHGRVRERTPTCATVAGRTGPPDARHARTACSRGTAA